MARPRNLKCAHTMNSEDHRWSEVIPPHTGLTFAAIWDPDEGMVTFSGARLFDAEPTKTDARVVFDNAPADAVDSQSQVLTIDRFALALGGSSLNTGLDTYGGYTDILEGIIDAYMEDLHPGLPPGIPPTPRSAALASSQAYVSFARDTDFSHPIHATTATSFPRVGRRMLPTLSVPGIKLFAHRKRKSGSSQSDSDAVHDEGFFEERRLTSGTFGTAPVLVNLNLKSTFSVTTTSTSNYVEVDFPVSEVPPVDPQIDTSNEINSSSSWSTLSAVDRQYCSNVPTEQRRRLKKARGRMKNVTTPIACPTDPAEVLAREHYNHVLPNSSSGCLPLQRKPVVRAKALLDRLSICRKNDDDDERWVCVEVTHKVTQRIV